MAGDLKIEVTGQEFGVQADKDAIQVSLGGIRDFVRLKTILLNTAGWACRLRESMVMGHRTILLDQKIFLRIGRFFRCEMSQTRLKWLAHFLSFLPGTRLPRNG